MENHDSHTRNPVPSGRHRHARPYGLVAMKGTPSQRFWSKVNRNGPKPAPETGLVTNCWLWTASTNAGGYGLFTLDGVHLKAHRYAYTFLVKNPDPGMMIDHICHQRNCVRPDHLREATRAQNTQNVTVYKNNIAGVRGVYYEAATGRYRVIVRHNGKNHQGGRHDNLANAELAAINLRNRLFTHNSADKIR